MTSPRFVACWSSLFFRFTIVRCIPTPDALPDLPIPMDTPEITDTSLKECSSRRLDGVDGRAIAKTMADWTDFYGRDVDQNTRRRQAISSAMFVDP